MNRTLITIVLSATLAGGAFAQDQWNQFRGPGARGMGVGSASLPVRFGPDENCLWRCEIPGGHSSPCLWGDRVFLTSHDGEKLETLCIDRASGKILWRRPVDLADAERVHRVNSLASPTPTTDGERVIVSFGSFGLVCYDFAGKELWRRALPRPKNTFGTASSPVLAGNWLIFARDTNAESYIEVMDKRTGKTVWKKDRTGFQSGWSTPVVWRRGDVEELLVYGAFRLTSYDLNDGTERWSVPGLADEPCITPVTGEGLVFVSSYNMRTNPEVIGLPPYKTLLEQYDTNKNGTLSREEVKDNKSILSRMDADGEGDHPLRGFFRFLDKNRDGELDGSEWQKMFAWMNTFKHANALVAIRPGDGAKKDAEIVWQHGRGVPECPSPLYVAGRIFLVKNGGIATCLDARTGEVKYQERIKSRGPRYSSPVVGDGKIYTASARGLVTVLAVGDTLRILAQNDLKERVMATPALADGHVYVRTEKALYCFGEK